MNAISDVMAKLEYFIFVPATALLISAGLFLFLFGLVEFLWNLNKGGDNQEGKNHMLWGIAGMFIMVSVLGIIALLENTFGLDPSNPDTSRAEEIFISSGF